MVTSSHVLVLGSSSGIGASIARSLAGKGLKPYLFARQEDSLAAQAAKLEASYTVGDVLDDAALKKATEDAAEAGGGALKGLVYAVGSINLKPAHRISEEDVLGDFRINTLQAFKAIQLALPFLKQAEGTASILLFSTVAVAQGFAMHASIGMAKGAIEGLTLSLAAELAPKIRVNCIAPSLTKTNLSQKLTSNATMVDAIAGLHPLQRLGEPDDIGPLGALLLSDEGSWITGQVIGIDGGRSSLRTKG